MISITPTQSLTIAELDRLVKLVEPAALLASHRLLRRVIKRHRALGGFGLRVPHAKGYVIEREALLRCVAPTELGWPADAELPPFVFLMVEPSARRLAKCTADEVLVKYWRILFHLHIDLRMQQKRNDGSLTLSMVRERVRRIGLTEFAEISAVLRQENYLLEPDAAEAVYAEFVAVYLTLRRFDPGRVSHFFPALRDIAVVDAMVNQDIDAEPIYHATRLSGAPEPTALPIHITQTDELLGDAPGATNDSAAPTLDEKEVRTKVAALDAEGNTIQAAILRARAHSVPVDGPPELSRLRDRLKMVLELSDADAEDWREALLPLLACAAHHAWGQEARLLYDLQSVCVDGEHGIYTVDLVEWMLSLGELPIKRKLPGHQEVVIVRRLRQALDRMRFVRIADAERLRLLHLLSGAVARREHLMRERFRPLLATALDEVGLKPSNVVEEIGRAKLIEELLDRVVQFGHLNIGNLRDAISRNQLKLPDLKSPAELLLGDPLIRLNRKLAVALDGVYRRGESYMRQLHRVSSVAFGTAFGRFLVLFLILPFGAAFFALITPGIAFEEGEKLVNFVGRLIGMIPEPPERGPVSGHVFPVPNMWGVLALGVFFLLLFNLAGFRAYVFYAASKVGRGLRRVLVDGPLWFFYLPVLQAALHNRLWRMFRRSIVWPALMATATDSLAWWYELGTASESAIAAGSFVLSFLLLNTRLGQDVEENVSDWLLRFWIWFGVDLVPGLLHWIMDVSRWCLDAVEQILYTVNESLRFRSGANPVVIVLKAILGLFWSGVTYVIRFAVNLLIEPQANPIKHFPVVTVSHKVCLPMIPTLASVLKNTLNVANPTTTATGIIFGIPGIFGFMVWELKENWKLYNSNRRTQLQPVLIGSHGETMLRLLHPGFHSGTIPKLYKKLRRAELHGDPQAVRKMTAALHHVAESVTHFVEREMLTLLRQSKGWGGLTIELAPIQLATNRILIELRCPSLGECPLVLAIDQQNSWLLAGVLDAGWLPKLNADQRLTLAAALLGLYKMAGVDLTREQIEASLPATSAALEIAADNLIVWAADLLLTNIPVTWAAWVRIWEADRAGGERRPLDVALLPAVQA